MKKNILYILFLFNLALFLSGCAIEEDKDFVLPEKVLADFNICDQWYDNMTWKEFQAIRTNLKRKSLIPFVDKIQANKMLKEQNIPVVPVIFASNKKENFINHIKNMKTYVAKPSHMSHNNGLIIVDNDINTLTNKRITPEEVQKRMHELLDTPTNSDEWVLRNIPRGFLIQEYIRNRQEIKIQTIWGKPVEIVWVQGGQPMILNNYQPDGRPLGRAPTFPFSQEVLERAKNIAKQVAKDTDALRVDMLVRTNPDGSQDLLVNELELRSAMLYVKANELARQLNLGYKHLCEANK